VRSWSDADPSSGKNFYRIKVVKPTPCFPTGLKSDEYSAPFSNYDEETIVGIDALNENELLIYPNPFQESTIITFSNPDHKKYQLILRDVTGKVVIQMGEIWDEKIELSRGDLSSGLYLLELQGVKTYRSKVIIN